MVQKPISPREYLGLFGLIRDLGHFTAILFGVVYISGFLVVHSYLGSLGIILFGVLNVQYLVAGTMFVCAVALVWLPAWIGEMIAVAIQKSREKKPPKEVFWTSFGGRIAGAGGGWLLTGLLLHPAGVAVDKILTWVASAYILHVMLRFTYLGTKAIREASMAYRFAMLGFVLLFILVVLSQAFGRKVYPHTSRAVGGGRPVRMELKLYPKDRSMPDGLYDVLAVTNRQWVLRDTTGVTCYLVPSEQVKVAILMHKPSLLPSQ